MKVSFTADDKQTFEFFKPKNIDHQDEESNCLKNIEQSMIHFEQPRYMKKLLDQHFVDVEQQSALKQKEIDRLNRELEEQKQENHELKQSNDQLGSILMKLYKQMPKKFPVNKVSEKCALNFVYFIQFTKFIWKSCQLVSVMSWIFKIINEYERIWEREASMELRI